VYTRLILRKHDAGHTEAAAAMVFLDAAMTFLPHKQVGQVCKQNENSDQQEDGEGRDCSKASLVSHVNPALNDSHVAVHIACILLAPNR
jgi:hypothetical protein